MAGPGRSKVTDAARLKVVNAAHRPKPVEQDQRHLAEVDLVGHALDRAPATMPPRMATRTTRPRPAAQRSMLR